MTDTSKKKPDLELLASLCGSPYLEKPPEVTLDSPPPVYLAGDQSLSFRGVERVRIVLTFSLDTREFRALREGSEAIRRLVEDCAPYPGCLSARARRRPL